MKQLFLILMGVLVMSGYFMYESILYGFFLWLCWNLSSIGIIFGLPNITIIQSIAILFIIRILRFDSAKVGKEISNK